MICNANFFRGQLFTTQAPRKNKVAARTNMAIQNTVRVVLELMLSLPRIRRPEHRTPNASNSSEGDHDHTVRRVGGALRH